MDLVDFIGQYGYFALAAGTFLEGETALIIAGFAASREYLALPAVILVAAIASFFGDQLCFYIGRRYGAALLARKPCVQAKVERVTSLLHRHHAPLILSIKFLYGLRTAGLIAIGMSNVPWPRFLAFNFLSALVWAACVGGASYVFGRTLENVFTDFSEYGTWMMGASLLFGSVWIVLSRRRQARAAAKRQADPDRR